MKICALDIGDVWTGVALSDALQLIARPHKTVKTVNLEDFLSELLAQDSIEAIVVGHPQTMRATASMQTKKIEEFFLSLKNKFPAVSWVLWDERMTSKQAQSLKQTKTKEEKQFLHAVAAAFILEGYLQRLLFMKQQQDLS